MHNRQKSLFSHLIFQERCLLPLLFRWVVLILSVSGCFGHASYQEQEKPVAREEAVSETVTPKRPPPPADPCKSYIERMRGHPISDILREIETPKQAADFVANVCYKKDDDLYGENHWASLFQTHQNGGYGDCDDIAVMALAILSDDMRQLRVLTMAKWVKEDGDKKKFWHAVALYEKDGKYGSIGHKDSYQPAKYDTLAELVDAIDGYTEYIVYDLTRQRSLLLRSDIAHLRDHARVIERSESK